MRNVRIFTDGSCLGNPGRGGWAAIIEDMDMPGNRMEIADGFRLTTNNRMEVLAAISALQCLDAGCEVEIHTDSQYLSNAISKGWLANWEKRNWQDVKNADLWQTLAALLKQHNVRMRWVKGHAGHPENEQCDVLAKMQARRNDLPPDRHYEILRNGVEDEGQPAKPVILKLLDQELSFEAPPDSRIYLASPYTAATSGEKADRYERVCKATAELSKAGYLVFSPIAHSHPIAEFGLPENFDFWRKWCLSFLDGWATHFCILKLDG